MEQDSIVVNGIKITDPKVIGDVKIADLEGRIHNFPSNHEAFMWVTSRFEIEHGRNMKCLSDLEKDNILVKMPVIHREKEDTFLLTI